MRSVRGRTGGTFAHWQIGLAYAKHLSPELHRVCNQIVKDFVEAKPEIAMSVTARADKKGVAKIVARDCAWDQAGAVSSVRLEAT